MRNCFIILTSFCLISNSLNGQEVKVYNNEIFKINGQELEYLDFGGSGLPLIFMAGNSRPPSTWENFAPLFKNNNHVLALADRGLNSTKDNAFSTKQRALDVIGFLDFLGIDKAVIIANSNPGDVLIYLAEHYPDRLAGLVFLANAPEGPEFLGIKDDPTGWIHMVERANLSLQGKDPERAGEGLNEAIKHVPIYWGNSAVTFDVKALTFTNLHGTRGLDLLCIPIMYAKLVEQNAITIPDNTSNNYFKRLAKDSALQEQVNQVWDSIYAPAYRRAELYFKNAFKDNLTIVAIDVPKTEGVPLVSGYEYLNAPDLIYKHLVNFIENVNDVKIKQ